MKEITGLFLLWLPFLVFLFFAIKLMGIRVFLYSLGTCLLIFSVMGLGYYLLVS